MNPRVILVTGANSQIGAAIARAFLGESADNFVWLGIHHRSEVVQSLEAGFGARCRRVNLDVAQPEAWQVAVATVIQSHQRLDVLVNNAGLHEDALLAMMPLESWQRVLRTNLDSVFHGCQAVLPTMISQRHGRIVNVASLSALLAPPGQTNYAAAKAGVVALTQSLAKEVARLGVTVNAVCPGYIETGGLSSMPAAEQDAARARVPMRRFGKPEEVAAAVRFLACSDAAYITGSVLKIDGGIL